jgi:polygalacturonase
MFIQIKDCDGVRIKGLTLVNAPFWHIHLLYSENITVADCRIIAPSNSPNTDALNTDSCRHVLVRDCFADVGDDGFGIKSGRDEEGRKVARPTEDVTYLRCHVAHGHSVCSIGSEASGSVRHVRFIDCTGDGTDNGIRLKSMRGRGGVVEDVDAWNVRLNHVRNAIVISARYVKTPAEPYSDRTPLFRDIHIDHVTAAHCGTCCTIEGLEEGPIQNVTLTDLNLSGAKGVSCAYARDVIFNNVSIAAEADVFVEDQSQNVVRLNWKEATPVSTTPASN